MEKVIVLPGKEEMLARLMKVDGDQHLAQKFYPEVLKSAGKKLVPVGVVMMFSFAIYAYTEGMPPAVSAILYLRLPDFIDSIIDDKESAQEAKRLLDQVFEEMKK